MMIVRPDGSGHYTVVGVSPLESLTPGALNTFSDVDIAVESGDRLGLFDPTGDATIATLTFAGADIIAAGTTTTQPSVGEVLTPTAVIPGMFRLNISAELSPADSTAPTTTISLSPALPNGDNGWYTVPVGVAVSADDDSGSGISETRCVLDPPTPPSLFGDLPAGCDYLTVAPTSRATGTTRPSRRPRTMPATKKCLPPRASRSIEPLRPSRAPLRPRRSCPARPGRLVTATVSDAGSRPVSTSVSASASTTTGGAHTVDLTGRDNAGNTVTASCPYVVGGYTFAGFASPLPKSTIKAGSTLPLKFQLLNASGQPIGDTEAQSLIAPSCKISITLSKPAGPVSGCPKYDPTSKQFQLNLKTTDAMKGDNGVSLTVMVGGAIVATGDLTPFTVR